MIRLFCLTGGNSNDILAKVFARRPYQLSNASGVLGDLDEKKLAHVTETLRDRGYYVFEQRLSPDFVARIVEFASTHKSTIRPSDADSKRGIGPRVTVYDRANPQGLIYDFDPEDLVNNPHIQTLIADPSIFAVAQAYIGGSPMLDEVNMWWSVAGNKQPDSAAAQLYHFDMDRIRWIKFFINLTDVSQRMVRTVYCRLSADARHSTAVACRGIRPAYRRAGAQRVSGRTRSSSSPRRRGRFSRKIPAACTEEGPLSKVIG